LDALRPETAFRRQVFPFVVSRTYDGLARAVKVRGHKWAAAVAGFEEFSTELHPAELRQP